MLPLSDENSFSVSSHPLRQASDSNKREEADMVSSVIIVMAVSGVSETAQCKSPIRDGCGRNCWLLWLGPVAHARLATPVDRAELEKAKSVGGGAAAGSAGVG